MVPAGVELVVEVIFAKEPTITSEAGCTDEPKPAEFCQAGPAFASCATDEIFQPFCFMTG